MTGGDIGDFFFRPITLIVMGIALASVIFFMVRGLRESA